eukprot:1301997-Rhodomonas_salina.3
MSEADTGVCSCDAIDQFLLDVSDRLDCEPPSSALVLDLESRGPKVESRSTMLARAMSDPDVCCAVLRCLESAGTPPCRACC